MKRQKFALFGLTVLLLLCAAGCGNQADNTTDTAAQEDEPFRLENFTASTLDGGTFTQTDLQDKDVTILNFWTTTCGPCISEMPDLAELEQALPENVQLLTVCLDGDGYGETAKEILQEAGYAGVTLLRGDPMGAETYTMLCNAVRGTPTTVFFNSAGELSDNIIVGTRQNLAKEYLAAVNDILASEDKPSIELN